MKTIFEVVLNTATSESPSVVWTKFMAMCSHAWSKLSYEVSLRSSSAPRSSFLFGNSLVKLIDLHGKFFSAKTNPSEATGDSHRSLSSSTLRSSEDSYIGGDLNVWSMFGIVIGAIVVLACFYYVVNCLIQRQVAERNSLRSIEEIPLVSSGSSSRRSRSS